MGAPDPVMFWHEQSSSQKWWAKAFIKIIATSLVCLLVGGPLFSDGVRAETNEGATGQASAAARQDVQTMQESDVQAPPSDQQILNGTMPTASPMSDATATDDTLVASQSSEPAFAESPAVTATTSDEGVSFPVFASTTASQEPALSQTGVAGEGLSGLGENIQQESNNGDAGEVVSPEREAQERNARERYLQQEMRDEIIRQFKQGCLDLNDGGYYCVAPGAAQHSAPEKHMAAGTSVLTVFSARDTQEEDAEIYLRTDSGESLQITHNATEDLFPARDGFSGNIVWQSLVGNAWQVFLYDQQVATSTQVSDLTSNAMNPSIDHGRVVWQGWANGYWEIFLAHEERGGGSTPAFTVEQITTDATHNMFPKIEGDTVAWQTYRDGVWHINAYSIANKKITQLTKGSEKHERPRFALVWDATDEQGNSTTMHYDQETGNVSPATGQREGARPFPPPLPENPSPASHGAPPPPPIIAKESQGDAQDAPTVHE